MVGLEGGAVVEVTGRTLQGRLQERKGREPLGRAAILSQDPHGKPTRSKKSPAPRFHLYNLGVAHGIPAVVALLAIACRGGIAADRARPLLDGTVRWLLAHQLPAGKGSCFGSFFVAGEDSAALEPIRDVQLSIATALMGALAQPAKVASTDRIAVTIYVIAGKGRVRRLPLAVTNVRISDQYESAHPVRDPLRSVCDHLVVNRMEDVAGRRAVPSHGPR